VKWGIFHVGKIPYYFEALNKKIDAIEGEEGNRLHKLQKQNSEYRKWMKKIDDKIKKAIDCFYKDKTDDSINALNKAEKEVISQINIFQVRKNKNSSHDKHYSSNE
tara:strand:+ start:237 stop:554 length:318 start_codon:yes stop_codon:yes gene_type:complete